MRRILAWSIPLALIVFGLLWPLVFRGGSEASDISDPVVFSNYKADFVVSADGRLDAVETITGEFPSSRHGIFRYWDVANQNSPRVRQKPEITSVLLDGEIVPYQLLWEDGQRFRVAKIGDPDRYLTYGTHVFEIRYTIPGVLDPGSTGANKQFAESTGDPELDVRVLLERHRAGLEQQNRTRRHLCHAARRGHRGAMLGRLRRRPGVPGSGRHGDTVKLLALDLPPRTPVTLRAGVDVPTPPQVSLPWPYTWDRILGRSVTGVLWVAGLTLAAGLIAPSGIAPPSNRRRDFRCSTRRRKDSDPCRWSTSAPKAFQRTASPRRSSISPNAE